jgi:3-hydroxyacyl-[acyl-carrier-protein] dehydratase
MMSDYFSILQCESKDSLSGIIRIQLNPDCRVYQGHFPKEPVSPGVCNIEMIRCCAEYIHHHPIRIRKIKQCRLTALMTPHITPQANVTISLQENEQGVYRLTASICEGETTYMTLKADIADE